jgi:hypothetical protein
MNVKKTIYNSSKYQLLLIRVVLIAAVFVSTSRYIFADRKIKFDTKIWNLAVT